MFKKVSDYPTPEPAALANQSVFTRPEAAIYLRISISKLDRLIKEGKLRTKKSDRMVRLTRQECDRWLLGDESSPREIAISKPTKNTKINMDEMNARLSFIKPIQMIYLLFRIWEEADATIALNAILNVNFHTDGTLSCAITKNHRFEKEGTWHVGCDVLCHLSHTEDFEIVERLFGFFTEASEFAKANNTYPTFVNIRVLCGDEYDKTKAL